MKYIPIQQKLYLAAPIIKTKKQTVLTNYNIILGFLYVDEKLETQTIRKG